MPLIYLDNNATTQPLPEVVAAVTEMQERFWANPSSVHRAGQQVRQRLELARASVAKLINASERELIFTSGSTESNNLALLGYLLGPAIRAAQPKRPLLITTKTEHPAIQQPAEALTAAGVLVVYLQVDKDGRVDPGALTAALEEHVDAQTRALVSIQWANNEMGVIQPVAALAAVCKAARTGLPVVFHCDATQAMGKIPVDVRAANVDMLSLAGHKFHGPKGIGALWVRSGVRLRAQNRGGPQERERRGGTENTPGIVGLGVAAEIAASFVHDAPRIGALRKLRDQLETGLLAIMPGTVVNGVGAERLWNTTNIAFPRLEAEAVLLGLSERGVCASAGAACSSGSLEPSPVLLAMGVEEPLAHGSVRFSLSRLTTAEEVREALDIVPRVIARLRQTLPM